MKNILITGGAGFIGSSLALKLIDRGYSVTVLDSLSEQIHSENPEKNSPLYQRILGKVKFIKGDVSNRIDLEKSIENQDAILHLAAETGTGQSMYEIERYNRVNVSGTALILDVLVNKKNGVKKFVLASSRAVYGEGKYQDSSAKIVYPSNRRTDFMEKGIFEMTDEKGEIMKPLPTSEDSKLHPTSFYGLTKLQQEQMVKLVCPTIAVDYVILRYQNVYGFGQSLINPYTGILSIFSSQILNGKYINIFEDGLPTRDFINIEDVVEATIRSLEMDAANNQTINIGTGIATTVKSVAENLVEEYQKDVTVSVTGNFRIGDIRHNFADIYLMKNLLHYEPKVSFSQGMQAFTQWVLKQPVLENDFEASLQEMKQKGFLKT
ncbi:NAD-dependent epimerase/dehydratase family protein [Chryseobacterium manosquense]|uniref:NAD-dependent epimerase/dehydratase family protein n=1 Tax=Chryseobacterium manosquense TaxID=2754694 RepID=A0A7H1DZK6_9FLAO|nr:NAD-dependent epimerase/dehydratase family protein [Chryseobacterium manosquense]QNS42414.1 NAD-dependent epimerase/dehydratase family protein [Chryseobacterium manosquense]